MRLAVAAACALVLVTAAGCGGSKKTTTVATTTPRFAHASASGSSGVDLVSREYASGLAGVPAAALPGVTVLGTGKETAAPDRALVSLTIGSGSQFGANGPTFSLVGRHELDPVVAALQKAGAEQISVDRFGAGVYDQSAAQITLTMPHPGDVEQALDAAQAALRTKTDYDLQAAQVVFTLSDCASVEQKAWKAALADAATRAHNLAAISGVELGDVLAVSEAAAAQSPYAPATTGCQALATPPSPTFVYPSSLPNNEQTVTVAVTLQVTYALAR